MGYKAFISGINTQIGGLLSKLLATATQTQQTSCIAHAEISRRKTEPVLLKKLSQPDITPLHVAATPFPGGSKTYVGRSPGGRPSTVALNQSNVESSGVQDGVLIGKSADGFKNQRQFESETEESNSRLESGEDSRSENGSEPGEKEEPGSSCIIT